MPSWYDKYGRKGSWSSLDGSTVAFLSRNFNVSPCFLVPCDMPRTHLGVPLKLPPVELQAACVVEGQQVMKLSEQALEELLERAAAGYVSETELALLARWVDSLEVKGEPTDGTEMLNVHELGSGGF